MSWLRGLLLASAILATPAGAQTFTPVAHPPPQTMYYALLLTDGSLLVQGVSGADWYRFYPDATGSYVRGVWAKAASMPAGFAPTDGSGFVFADGRAVYLGGEYNYQRWTLNGTSLVFNPRNNEWTQVPAPANWNNKIGDSSGSIRPDGRLLVGQKLSKLMAALDPVTLTWTPVTATGKRDWFAEENWTELPDGTILTVDVQDHPHTELFIPGATPDTGTWINAGQTPVNLWQPYEKRCSYRPGWYCPPGEIGPDLYMPDGTVWATGAVEPGQRSGHTAIYHPGKGYGVVGTWVPGPDFPDNDHAADCYAVNLPNGHALIEGDSDINGGVGFYDFDGRAMTTEPYRAGRSFLLLLPTGQVMIGGRAIMTPTGGPLDAWRPRITRVPALLPRGSTQKIVGEQFNGVTRGSAFGDEDEAHTNYPLVRISFPRTGHTFYLRTHDHSTMGFGTGNQTVWTYFDVAPHQELGPASLVVVANGIPSKPVAVTITEPAR